MVKRLTVRELQTISQPGLYSDGDGLYLQVTPPSSKTWIYRYQLKGRRRVTIQRSVRRSTSNREYGRLQPSEQYGQAEYVGAGYYERLDGLVLRREQ